VTIALVFIAGLLVGANIGYFAHHATSLWSLQSAVDEVLGEVAERDEPMHAAWTEHFAEIDDDEYPDCPECRNTGHPRYECGDLSGPDYRYWCQCEQGQDMKARHEDERRTL